MKRDTLLIILGILLLAILYVFKDKILNTMDAFKTKFLPIALRAAKVFGFSDPYFLLAQMYAENGGNSYLLNTANNVGSLISRYNGAKLPTNTWWKGDDVANPKNGLYFRKYDSIDDGFFDFAHLLSNSYHLGTAKNIQEFAEKIANSSYISEANGDNRAQYAQNIINTYNKLKA